MESPIPAAWRQRVFPVDGSPQLPRTREGLAFHEAGHVITADVLGLPVSNARISNTVGAFSLLEAQGTGPAMTLEQSADVLVLAARVQLPGINDQACRECVAVMFFAGRQAQVIHAGLEFAATFQMDADGQQARHVLRGMAITAGACQLAAYHLLMEHWQRVEGVAAELVTHGVWRPCVLGRGD